MIESIKCPKCSGKMWHSDDMDDPFAGDDNEDPYWLCENCDYYIDAAEHFLAGQSLPPTTNKGSCKK